MIWPFSIIVGLPPIVSSTPRHPSVQPRDTALPGRSEVISVTLLPSRGVETTTPPLSHSLLGPHRTWSTSKSASTPWFPRGVAAVTCIKRAEQAFSGGISSPPPALVKRASSLVVGAPALTRSMASSRSLLGSYIHARVWG